ncbi:MAG: LacI family transcriptional regulator [Hyphomicrobiales bacterium]|nr:MAG: LacI family transcriptional regulator [Hyphomicrobiales bacterium]
MRLSRLLALSVLAVSMAMPATGWAQSKAAGPKGEAATPSSEIRLTDDDVAKLKAGHHTAAMVWHMAQEYTSAVTAGAQDELDRLGIKVLAITEAGFDAARQQNNLETVMVRNPDVVLTLPVDPVSAGEAFRPALKQGTKFVIVDNAPAGWVQGKDYVTVVTDNNYEMGKHTADALAEAIGSKGKVGMIYYDADFFVTNMRDKAFKDTIAASYPDIKIVAEQGFADPRRVQEIADAMLLQHPDLDGIYTSWGEPAEGALAALRAAKNDHVKISTLDVNEVIGLDMAKDGNIASITVDEAYEIGRALGTAAGRALLGKNVPPYVVVPAVTLTKANLVDGWYLSMHRQAPQSIKSALGQ